MGKDPKSLNQLNSNLSSPEKKTPQKQNPFMDLLWNVIAPTLVLTKLSVPERLGPVYALILALAFPIGYGSYDLWKQKKINFFSILGLLNVLLTGGFGLAQLDRFWFAVKEASVPTLFGLAILASMRWTKAGKETLLEKMFLNESTFQMSLIKSKLENSENLHRYKAAVRRTTYLFALSFAVSAVLNFLLAIWLLKSPPGTPEFNAELGKMNALSFPVIALSCTSILIAALFWFLSDLSKLTGYKWDDLLAGKKKALEH